jgi:asparagine synthase (glutamine-hydrolysing)
MSGLVGWVGGSAGDVPPGDVLRAMAAGLGPAPGAPSLHGEAAQGCGLAVRSEGDGAWRRSEDGLWCAVDGMPRWSDPELAGIARSRGQGAALAHAYRQYGRGLLDRLNGAFAVALVEPAARRALLAIDRVGVKTMAVQPLAGGGLAFASSADALRGHPSADTSLSLPAIFEFLHFSAVSAPRTIYQEVRKLLPAQYVAFEDGRATEGLYWRIPYGEAPRATDRKQLVDELMRTLRSAVFRQVDGEDPARLGAYLSGGLDSSTVVGLAGEALGRPIDSYTMTFDSEDFDESRYARLAAAHFRSPHHTYRVTADDTAELLPKIAEVYDEPFGNSSAVPAYHCVRAARENGVAVMLAGDGGDELFAGNARYVLQQKFDLYNRVPRPLRAAFEPLLFKLPAGGPLKLVRRAQGYVRRARTPMPDRMETYNFLNEGSYPEIFTADFLASVDPAGPLHRLREIYGRCGDGTLLQRMLHHDMHITIADNDLRKVIRMADLGGAEVRFPFLEDEVVAFSARVPPALLTRRMRLRHFYKEAMRGFLPDEIIAKTKQGFGLPYRVWMSRPGRLRGVTMEVLHALKARRIVRPAFIDGLLAGWQSEEAKEYGQFVWYLIVLELWLQHRRETVTL